MDSHIPEIPHDKSYHLFVCYETKSVDFVREIVNNLEKEGVMCCYCDRDFTIGRSFIGNMYEAIQKSLFMLVVLSEEFQESPYCMHETEEAFNRRLKGEYDLIPIKIEPCTVPECLRHLVYIDVDDKDAAHNKIIEAMTKKDSRTDFREDRNGENIQIELRRDKSNCLSFTRYRLEFAEKERAEIWGNKFEVSADLLHEIENTVNESLLMKYGYICVYPTRNKFVSFLFLSLLILLMVVSLVLFITPYSSQKEVGWQTSGYCLAIGIPTLLIIYLISLYICIGLDKVYIKVSKLLLAELWDISSQNKKQTGMIFFIKHHNYLGPCYFARHMDERKFLKKFCRENETNEEYTVRMFDTYLSRFCNTLEIADTKHRHPMKNSAKCVCLLVEEWLKKTKEDPDLK